MATLLFIGGGPWDDKELDSRVEDPPVRIGPTPKNPGVYERVGSGAGEIFLYVWRADDRLDPDDGPERCANTLTRKEGP
jgi:hypothetical protein